MRTLTLLILLAFRSMACAGYELPSQIDGCRSVDGRFLITAEPIGKTTSHGPNQWSFVWKDTKTGETRTVPAQGVSGGQVHGQLFIAPDGETFALFNHVTLWYPGKSDMHGATKLWGDKAGSPRDIQHEAFSRRIIVYKKDGSILKELGVTDLLNQAELENVTTVFTRVHWVQEYPGLRFKETPRPGYAFYRVSPDYTVLEVRAVTPRGSKEKSGRVIRVSLTDGKILDPNAELEGDKKPLAIFPPGADVLVKVAVSGAFVARKIVLFDRATRLGEAPVVSGKAELQAGKLAPGFHTLIAQAIGADDRMELSRPATILIQSPN